MQKSFRGVMGALLGDGTRTQVEQALRLLVPAVFTLVAIGLVASSSFAVPGEELGAARRHALYVAIGLIAFLIGCRLPLEWIRRHTGALLALTVLLLALTFASPAINHARRWIILGPLTFQPSELAKITLVFFIAAFAAHQGERIRDLRSGFLAPLARVALLAGLVLFEPDFGTAVFLFVVAAVMLVVAGARALHFLMVASFALPILLVVAWTRFEHIAARIRMMGDDNVYQLLQSRIAMASGGLFGQGVGRGVMKLGLVPEGRNDFVFAQIGEEWGLLGTGVVIFLFGLFILCGVRILMGIRDRYLGLVTFGCLFVIAFQAVMNLAVVTRLVPPKGIALPFVSAGGTSLTFFMLALGCIVGAARRSIDASAEASQVQLQPATAPEIEPGLQGEHDV